MKVHDTNNPGCRRKSTINLAGFLARSSVNGPGIRSVVWVQGCPIHCEGCFNPQFLPFTPAQQVTPSVLANRICAQEPIDGVTLSGGEPFAQADALGELGELLQHQGHSIVTFSGFSPDLILRSVRPAWQRLLAVTDLLIAGPFIPSLKCNTPWVGSSNQKIIPLTGNITMPESHPPVSAHVTEFTIHADGTLTATGFPERHFVKALADRCRGV
ncbi:MAG: 4Fe-4S single cluster domain-containing protein [Methanoregula sp.]|nr:4Fe-4S single cluster domain-containing protein [Methanoregula sp.]